MCVNNIDCLDTTGTAVEETKLMLELKMQKPGTTEPGVYQQQASCYMF